MLCICGCVASLCVMSSLPAFAAETEPAQTTASASEEKETGKTGKILGFLAIFTVACGGTAYLVMRPSLRKLREAKEQAKSSEPKTKE